MKRFICCLVAALSFFFLSGCAQDVANPLFPCTEKLDNPYGMTAHFTLKSRDYSTEREQIALMKQAGIGNVRNDLWVPYNEKWTEHELLPITNAAIKKIKRKDLDLLGILFVGWSKQRAWERTVYYNEFLNYLISKYKDIVPYWEVMNEVNLTSNEDKIPLDSTLSLYMSLLPTTYRKLKEANPNIIVTSSGLGDINDNFLELMCSNGAYQYFDVLNFHSYDLPEKFPEKYHKIRALMDEYGWHKPVWITECGMPTHDEKFPKGLLTNSIKKEEEQACRIARMHVIAFAYGIDKVYTYKFRASEKDKYNPEEHYGILHADLSSKPAFYAYKTMTQMLPSGSLRPTLTKRGATYVSYWKRPDRKNVWAIWNSSGTKKIKVEMKGKGQFYDYLGKKLATTEELTIGKGVVYIVGAKEIHIND